MTTPPTNPPPIVDPEDDICMPGGQTMYYFITCEYVPDPPGPCTPEGAAIGECTATTQPYFYEPPSLPETGAEIGTAWFGSLALALGVILTRVARRPA